MAELVRARLLVSGRVQGVGFRWSTVDQARRLGVRGWVRNRPDGRVEAEVEGERRDVEALVAWCRRGPPAAEVDDVEVGFAPHVGDLDGFSARH